MAKALVALHYQNDICHREGRIPFAMDYATDAPQRFLSLSSQMLEHARAAGWNIIHVHIAFATDYADLPRNCRLFQAVERLGAVQRGSWGAAAMEGFTPATADIALVHRCNNAFEGTGLADILSTRGITHIAVMGLATQFSVEHTVRHAADLGLYVTVVSDCCASADPDAHAAALKTMAMLAEVAPLDKIVF